MSEWYIRREYNIGGVMPRAEVCERGADPFHIICEALPEVARQIVADHEDAARLRAALDAMTEAKNSLLLDRDQYMDRFGLLLPWLSEHVMARDSDVLDIDHGPIVEWEYCDWCEDHGLESDWPCLFARVANPTLATLSAARPPAGAAQEATEKTYCAAVYCFKSEGLRDRTLEDGRTVQVCEKHESMPERDADGPDAGEG